SKDLGLCLAAVHDVNQIFCLAVPTVTAILVAVTTIVFVPIAAVLVAVAAAIMLVTFDPHAIGAIGEIAGLDDANGPTPAIAAVDAALGHPRFHHDFFPVAARRGRSVHHRRSGRVHDG